MIIKVKRWAIATVAIVFGTFHAILGFASLSIYTDVSQPLLAMILYLLALYTSILLYRSIHLPTLHAIFAVTVAITLPLLTNPHVPNQLFTSFATWYVGGAGVLLTVVVVRRQYWLAWIGASIVFAEVMIWAGKLQAMWETGLLGGMVFLLAAGQAVSVGVEVAAARAKELSLQATNEEAAAIATSVRRTERQIRSKEALEKSRPILERILERGGRLEDAERREAMIAEIELRDEIRGRLLLNDTVRSAARKARDRFVEVSFLDEGGLESTSQEELERIHNDIVAAIDSIQVGRIIVRAPKGENWRVTVVAVEPGASKPSLWLKLGEA